MAIMEQIVDKFIDEVNGQLLTRKVTLTLSDGARTWLAKKGYDPVFGARPLARLIQTEIKDALADEILFGRLTKGGGVFVNIEKDKPGFVFS